MSRGRKQFEEDDVCSLDSDSELIKYIEQELLTCRYCQAPLKAVPLDVNDETGEQRFFWTCRNVKAMSCHFPIGLPNQVYWLTRTAEQRQLGFFPRPAVHKLPQEYRSLYPIYFAQEARKSSSVSRSPSVASTYTGSFVCPTSTHSPCTSTSSTLSENQSVEHLNDVAPKSIWESVATKLREASSNLSDRKRTLNSGVMESSSGSTEVDSTTYASSEFSDGDLADVICDQLEEMGIDVYMMEDEDLIREMSSAVKTLKGPTNSTAARRLRLLIAHDRITTDYLFNLDVTPIKRRLNVISSDLTRAVAVMRSDCDVDTLLDAMRGGCVSEPSAKRLKSEELKAETKRRVEALLKQLAEQRHATNEEQGTLAEATSAEPDPDGAKEWFDGEDGPSTSAPTEISENAAGNLDEEARLDAIVQSKVRSHIEKAAARRHALKSKKQRVSAQQAEHSVLQRTEAHTHIHATSPLNVGIFDDDDALLSFDSPYMEESFANDSALDFTPKEPSVSVSLQHLERGTLSPPHDAHATTVDPSNTHASDNVDLDLFDGFDFLF